MKAKFAIRYTKERNFLATSVQHWDENIKTRIEQMEDRLLTTYKLLRDYINEMESHMLPVNENAMMRVDRNDIYWNIMEMETIMETLSDMSLDIHESPVDYIKDHAGLAAEQLGIVIAGEQEERKKRERSYQKILNYNQKVRSTVMPVIQEHLNDILSIYQDSIVPFENADDTYRSLADNLYSEWAPQKKKYPMHGTLQKMWDEEL